MLEGIGYGSASAFLPRLGEPTAERTAAQIREMDSRQNQSVAETVQRQANFNANRAENLERVADQLESRAETTAPEGAAVGGLVDITV